MSERGGIVLSRRLFLVGVGAAAVAAIAKVCVPIVHPHDCLVLLDSDEPLTIFSISMNASAADPYSNVSVRRDGQTLIRLAAQRYGWCEYQAPLGGGIVVAKGSPLEIDCPVLLGEASVEINSQRAFHFWRWRDGVLVQTERRLLSPP